MPAPFIPFSQPLEIFGFKALEKIPQLDFYSLTPSAQVTFPS